MQVGAPGAREKDRGTAARGGLCSWHAPKHLQNMNMTLISKKKSDVDKEH